MSKQHWQDGIKIILGIWTILTPWIVQHAFGAAALSQWPEVWTFTATGVAVLAVGTAAFMAFRRWMEWVNAALGAWLLISPRIVGFTGSTVLSHYAVIMGGVILVLAVWTLNEDGRGSRATNRS